MPLRAVHVETFSRGPSKCANLFMRPAKSSRRRTFPSDAAAATGPSELAGSIAESGIANCPCRCSRMPLSPRTRGATPRDSCCRRAFARLRSSDRPCSSGSTQPLPATSIAAQGRCMTLNALHEIFEQRQFTFSYRRVALACAIVAHPHRHG